MRVKFQEYRDEVIAAMNSARSGTIISRGVIEAEIAENPKQYPGLAGRREHALRQAISVVLLNTPGILVLPGKSRSSWWDKSC